MQPGGPSRVQRLPSTMFPTRPSSAHTLLQSFQYSAIVCFSNWNYSWHEQWVCQESPVRRGGDSSGLAEDGDRARSALPSKWDPCFRSEAVYGQYEEIQGRTIPSRCYTDLEGVARLGHEGMSMVSPRFLPEAWRARGAPGCAVMEVTCSRSLDMRVELI